MSKNPNKPLTECDNCNLKERWLLHNVRLRGLYRRLCTPCVLKLHPGSFCPTCFDLFEVTPPHNLRVICQKCPSISHPNCIPNLESSSTTGVNNGSKPYICPSCSNPNFSFFELVKGSGIDGGEGGGGGAGRGIDENGARVLLCAARIASLSMNKAVVVAKAEAERRVREAALSKKRAREALDILVAVTVKEKAKRCKEENGGGSGTASSGVVGTEFKSDKVKVERISGEVLRNLNLRETVSGPSEKKEVLVSQRNVSSASGENIGNRAGSVGDNSIRNEKEMLSNSTKMVNASKKDNGEGEQGKQTESIICSKEEDVVKGEKMNDGSLSVQPAEDQRKKTESSHGMEKAVGST